MPKPSSATHKTTNWKDYNVALKKRGSLLLRHGMVASLLKLSGLDWPVPDYSTLCRRQQDLKVCISYRSNSDGPHLLVDSTGIKMLGEGEWKTKNTVPNIVGNGVKFI